MTGSTRSPGTANSLKNSESQAFVERRRWPRVVQPPVSVSRPDPSLLEPLRFTTQTFSARQQLAAWQEHMAVLYEVRPPEGLDLEAAFPATQTVWDLQGMLLIQQAAPAFSYERSRNMVRFSPIDHWQVTFLRSGMSWTGVDERVAENMPGQVEIRSLGYPFRGRQLATESVSVIVPVDEFADRGGLPPATNNLVLSGQSASSLIGHISDIESRVHQLSQDDLPDVRARLRETVFNTFAPLVNEDGGSDRLPQIGLMARARRYIMENLTSPDLAPDVLCQKLAISRTRLYELFSTSGGVSNYIRKRRLFVAHAILADPFDHRKIAEVAYLYGFDSAANFSRAFSQQFGYSPSRIRKNAAGAQPHADTEPAARAPATFESLLRTLGVA